MKGAKRSPFDVVKKSLSSILEFSLGAWNFVVLPSVRYWHQVGEEDMTCKVGSMEIKIVSVELGKEAGGKHIDTKVVFSANSDKIVAHLYNTTQRILVNGQGYEQFIRLFLKPYFESKLSGNIQNIENFNKEVLAALSGKRKAVTRPTRSVRYKAMTARPTCTQCDESFTNKSMLGVHTKSTHKLSARNGSVNTSNFPVVDDLSLMEVSLEYNMPGVLELEEECSVVSYNCGKCSDVFVTAEELEAHCNADHSDLPLNVNKINTILPTESTEGNSEFVCEDCAFKANDSAELDFHTPSHAHSNHTAYNCGTCTNVYKSFDDLAEHIDQQHKPELEMEPLQSCERCDFTTEDVDELDDHYKNNIHNVHDINNGC